jgi:hypothetical protein
MVGALHFLPRTLFHRPSTLSHLEGLIHDLWFILCWLPHFNEEANRLKRQVAPHSNGFLLLPYSQETFNLLIAFSTSFFPGTSFEIISVFSNETDHIIYVLLQPLWSSYVSPLNGRLMIIFIFCNLIHEILQMSDILVAENKKQEKNPPHDNCLINWSKIPKEFLHKHLTHDLAVI